MYGKFQNFAQSDFVIATKLNCNDYNSLEYIKKDDFINNVNLFSLRDNLLSVEQDFLVNKSFQSEINTSVGFLSSDTNTLQFDDIDTEIELLPSRMSFVEQFLWSKNGFLRKIGITSNLTPIQREKELGWRRNMLTVHQTLGLVSWSLMAGTVITGQLWLDGSMDSPDWHRRFLYSTIATYSLAAIISVFTPPPLKREKEFSSITAHKLLAWVHFIGMIATPILGKAISSSSDYYKAARIHQKIGYVTFSTYTISMLTILLFR
ncbi:MAG: hypothetical protein N2560_06260 [Ignavibacteria bacterium]|nr:hypothetical protein [Ignavibacteria bacterium]